MNQVLSSLPTPQEIEEAKYQGSTAGQLQLAGGLNPYEHKNPLSALWMSFRLQALSIRMSAAVR